MSETCQRPCCRRQPYTRVAHHGVRRWEHQEDLAPRPAPPIPRYVGIGLVLVVVAMIIGLVATGPDHPTKCGRAPQGAYRSAGLWYSGQTIIGLVDQDDPDCFPKP